MARSVGTVLLNNFSKGLITEATGLNFPDNAVTESDNVVFERVGRVTRRLGYDLEGQADSHGYGGDATAGVLREYLWEAVAKQGGFTFLVVQMGATIRFYEMNQVKSVSAGTLPIGIDLRDFRIVGGMPVNETPVSFSSGAGFLFISHPACDPIIVSYDSDTDTFSQSSVTIHVRDFEGLDDGLGVDKEPEELSIEHAYNLKNQGWYKKVRVGSVNNEPAGAVPPTSIDDWGLYPEPVPNVDW